MPVSIRSRLLLLVLSVLLPAVVAAVWVIVQTDQAERRALDRTLRDTTRALTTVVDRELSHRAAIARVLAGARVLQAEPTPAELRLFEDQARAWMDGTAGWLELRSARGVLVDTRRAQPSAGPVGPVAPLVAVPAVLPLTAGPAGEPAVAGVVHPVVQEGRTVFNVAVLLQPRELQAVIDAQQLPQNWLATVLDDRGTVVARHPGGAAHVGRRATPDLQARIQAAREGEFDSVYFDGAPVQGHYASSPQGWVVVAARPQVATTAGLPDKAWRVALGALALLALAITGALWVTRRIVAPVQALRLAAVRLRAGQPVDAASTGIVEYDQVAAALTEAGAAIRAANAELERQVDAAVRRTREAEQRVSHNQRVEALGRLTGGVAHDFNNLLGVIGNSAHLIQRQLGLPVQAPIDAVLRAVDAGSRLTRQLLRFAGRQPLTPAPVDLARTLPELHELMQTVLGKRIEVITRVAADTRIVTIDPNELELALINVALNARDAMPSGGHLWLGARNAEPDEVADLPPGEHVLITLTDDGRGIDEALAERVFEPFFTTKPMGQGTGLGLSQVHGLCVQAGGTARLASTPGLGTTVTLVLPAAGSGPPDHRAEPRPSRESDTEGLVGRRVLLVEDNPELGDVTAALLATFGAEVHRAANPQEALHHIENGPPFDIVLSDIVMPGDMDGLTLAHRLRAERPGLPVVLISGYSDALQQARDDFPVLRKPTTPAQLVSTLRAALGAAGATPPDGKRRAD